MTEQVSERASALLGELLAGREVTGKWKTVTDARAAAYSSKDIAEMLAELRDLHGEEGGLTGHKASHPTFMFEEEYAKRLGKPSRFIVGGMYTGYANGFMVEVFGDVWFYRGRCDYKLINSTLIGDDVQVHARLHSTPAAVMELQANSDILVPPSGGPCLEVWIENQDGVKSLWGTSWLARSDNESLFRGDRAHITHGVGADIEHVDSLDAAKEAQVGKIIGPFEVTWSVDLSEQFAYVAQDYHPMYINVKGQPSAIVHPMRTAQISVRDARGQAFYEEGWAGLHARDQQEWHRPLYSGETFEVQWEWTDLYIKRGRPTHVREVIQRVNGELQLKVYRTTAFANFLRQDTPKHR